MSLSQNASQLQKYWGATLPPLRCTSWKAHLLRGLLAISLILLFFGGSEGMKLWWNKLRIFEYLDDFCWCGRWWSWKLFTWNSSRNKYHEFWGNIVKHPPSRTQVWYFVYIVVRYWTNRCSNVTNDKLVEKKWGFVDLVLPLNSTCLVSPG